MSDDGCWFGPGAGLGARHKHRVPVKAARRAVGAAGACASSAAQRCGPVPLPLVLAALGAALIRISMRGGLGPAARGLLLGVAGVLFGVSDIALKYLTEALHGGVQGIVSEWTLAALAASVLAFYASARGLQLAPGVAVIAFTSVAANLAAIMGGSLVFRAPFGIGALAIVGRVIAFGLVIAGAALMPAPLHASETPGRSS